MKMVTRIAFSNMKYHKSKNILIGIAMILTTLLLFLVPTVGKDMIDGQFAAIDEIYASWHALFRNVDTETAKQLAAHHDVKVYGLRSDAGFVVHKEADISMMYLDETGRSLCKVELAEGRMPKKADEIAVAQGLLEELGISAGIGDVVTIPYQINRNGTLDYAQEREFTVTGLLPDSEGSRKNRKYIALISHAFLMEEIPEGQIAYRFLFQVNADDSKTTDEIEAIIKNLAAQFGIAENSMNINSEYLGAHYVDPAFLSAVVIIMLIVVFAGVITMYSIYYVSMKDSVQEFGKLKAIGTTKRQLKQIVFREGFLIALFAIPVGLLLGTVLSKAVFMAFLSFSPNNQMVSAMRSLLEDNRVPLYHWWIYLLAAAVTCVTVYLSLLMPMRVAAKVSEIEAMRYQGKVRKRKTSFTDITLPRLTRVNLMGNQKRSLVTILSMGMTGIFVMVIATVLSCANPAESASNSIFRQYEISAKVERGNREHPEREWSAVVKDNPLSPELKQQIEAVEGVTKVDCFSMVSVVGGELEETGANICGIPEDYAKLIENGIIEGEATYEDLKSGDKIIVDKMLLHWYPVKVGDVLNLTIEDGENTHEKTFEVVAIGDYGNGVVNYDTLIMAKEAADALCRYNSSRYFHVSAKKDYDANVENALKEIIGQSELLQMNTWKKEYDSWKNGIAVTSGACYAFLAILGVICVMNLINTMIHSVHVRKKEIGMMQAIGMSNRQLIKMLQMEGLFYTLGTLALSVGAGSILGYPLFLWAKENGWFSMREYHYPLSMAIFISVLLFLLQMVLAGVLGRSVKKESLIERIRFSG